MPIMFSEIRILARRFVNITSSGPDRVAADNIRGNGKEARGDFLSTRISKV